MSRAGIKFKVEGLLPLKRQMQLLTMPKATRRRLLYRVARRVMIDSRRRVREQVDLNGQPYAKRKRKSRRKMLSGLSKKLKVINNNSIDAVIGFAGSRSATVAAKQQHGYTQTISAKSLPKNKGGHKAQATRRQAKALREAGYTIKSARSGRRVKLPSLKWVTENLNVGQAGAALRYLREQAGEKAKTSWQTVLPARSFLGASARDVTRHIDTIFKQITTEIKHVAR